MGASNDQKELFFHGIVQFDPGGIVRRFRDSHAFLAQLVGVPVKCKNLRNYHKYVRHNDDDLRGVFDL